MIENRPIFEDYRDDIISEVEQRIAKNGEIIYPEVAKVIGDFEKDLGINPYPRVKSFEGVFKEVNPGFPELGTSNNCAKCTATMELRGRGYNVIAGRSIGGVSSNVFERWFKDSKIKKCKSIFEFKSEVLSFKSARGALSVFYGEGYGSGYGGHSVHWMVKENELIISDAQIGKQYFDIYEFLNSSIISLGVCKYVRLDLSYPNWKNLAEDSVIGVNSDVGIRRWKNERTGEIFKLF